MAKNPSKSSQNRNGSPGVPGGGEAAARTAESPQPTPETREVDSPVHRQVWVTHPREGRIEVDAGMARLLTALWARGIDTFMSCQDTFPDNQAWLAFPTEKDALAFLRLAWRIGGRKMQDRIDEDNDVPGSWLFTLGLNLFGNEPDLFIFDYNVYFPVKDKDTLANRLEKIAADQD